MKRYEAKLRPLKPTSAERIEWEADTCHELQILADMDCSDAQGQMMCYADAVDDAYARGDSPQEAARFLNEVSLAAFHSQASPGSDTCST